jgi:hypothetical protein
VIYASNGNGLVLAQAQGILVGGLSPANGNIIVGNSGFGLLAFGLCNRSQVIRNTIANNAGGNVNIARAQGLRFIPRRP